MTGLLLVVGLAVLVVAFLVVGTLARIADAIEAQNRFYGITDKTPEPKPEETA